jgi:hypothetical protein
MLNVKRLPIFSLKKQYSPRGKNPKGILCSTKQFFCRSYAPIEFVLEIFKAFLADPMTHAFGAIKFAVYVGHCFFPTKSTVLVPEQPKPLRR